ncbi:TPA: hypothetical protein ACPO6A_000396 [Haemophilus influenzae]|uniref:hypothetical protein n=1 Tax=Haemophilus influenzae TaxID=727 RepID=UPI000E567EFC|nr:hypothetical protein [Haemophilus influenzae]MCK9006079.1 hypothetical protein [Haemophilus influenzae]
MDVIEIRESAVVDFKRNCIETCNEIKEVVNAWIKHEKKLKTSALRTSNIDIDKFECTNVNFILDQDGGESFLIYCCSGDDDDLAYEILGVAERKLGVPCGCVIYK